MKKALMFLILITTILGSCRVCSDSIQSYIKFTGIVEDSDLAIKIAEANWCDRYGNKVLKYKPFKAKRFNNIWIVYGSLKKGYVGGTPEAKIDADTGRVLEIYWTR